MLQKSLLCSTLLVATITPLCLTQSAQGATLTTLFATNNGGSLGGAVYFNLVTGNAPLSITGLTTNTSDVAGATPGFEVYTKLGTAEGSETDAGAWTLATTATITPSGVNNPSPVALDSSIALAANTLYGFALIMPSSVGHSYTNGSGCTSYTIGGNCSFANADLTFIGGSATNVPFTGSPFSPRIWNGSIEYQPVPEPLTMLGASAAVAFGAAFKRRKKQS